MPKVRLQSIETKKKGEKILMQSQLIKQWVAEKLQPSKDFEFFTRREDMVLGKLSGKPAMVEYRCPHCGFCEIKEIDMVRGKSGKKYKRPSFKCSKCDKTIKILKLK